MRFFIFFRSIALTILTTLLLGANLSAQITVSVNHTAEELVRNLVGSGVIILNPVLLCPSDANGIFKVKASNLGINGGIILSTGYAASAAGPASYLADYSNSSRGDEDLNTLSGQNTYDACKLEFDFIPTGETIKFRYVFGSEEYPSFACTQYNDVFAFYISGPGYPKPKNIALIPGTDIPVAINSTAGVVGTSGGKLNICEAMGKGSPFKEYYVNNSGGTTITYNGFTKGFTAVAAVTPCATYHLKLAIADAKDHQYDSGVFIEEGSLSSNTLSVSLKDNLQVPVPYCVRACKEGTFQFKRKFTSSMPLSIHFKIEGTALNGKDYKAIPDSIVIPAFDTVATLSIIPDPKPVHASKTIKLLVYSPFSCTTGKTILDSSLLTIYDSIVAQITTPDTLLCNGNTLKLMVKGDDALHYSWDAAEGISDTKVKEPVLHPKNSNTYKLNVSFLNCPSLHPKVMVNVANDKITLSSNKPCSGDNLQLYSAKFSGASYFWSGPSGFRSEAQNPIVPHVNSNDSGTYYLTLNYPGCNVKGALNVKILSRPEIISHPPDIVTCAGLDTSFLVIAKGAELTYQWQLNKGNGFENIINNTTFAGATSKRLKIKNTDYAMNGYVFHCVINGACNAPITSQAATLLVINKPQISISKTEYNLCSGENTTLEVRGEGKDLRYQWQFKTDKKEFTNLTNAAIFSGVKTNSLQLTNIPAYLDGYIFRCNSSGECGSEINGSPITLHVSQAPIITKQPQKAEVCANKPINLSVAASGTNLKYQWQFNKGSSFANVMDDERYAGALTAQLTINNVQENMSGTAFRCVVTGSCQPGITSNESVLQVLKGSRLLQSPVSSTVCAGGHTSFSVSAEGANIAYQWVTLNNNEITPLTNNDRYNGTNSNTLSVSHINSSLNNNKYACVISANCNAPITSTPAVLMVDTLPEIISQTSTQTICEGSSVSLNLKVKGPGLTYQWQMYDGSVFNAITDSGIFSGTSSASLNINNTPYSLNAAQFRCVIGSTCSRPVISKITTVNVNSAPIILKQPTNATFCVGGNTNFSISVKGLDISYHWQADTGNGFFNLPEKGNYSGTTTNTLLIKGAAAGMSSFKFRCLLNNKCATGLPSNSGTLIVNSWPVIKAKGNVLSVGDYKNYQWYFNNVPINGATEPTYKATKNGPYSVFVKDDNGCIDISPQYVVSNAEGEKKEQPNDVIRIYPNPATSYVNFDAAQMVNVKIATSRGKVVISKDNAKSIDISKLPNGVYIINVYDDTKKLLKTEKLLKNSW